MRHLQVLMAASALSVAGSAMAAEWITYTSMEDRFRVHLPCEFQVTDTSWDSEYFLGSVGSKSTDKPWEVKLKIHGRSVLFKLYSGADVIGQS